MKAPEDGTYVFDELTVWVEPGSSVQLKIVSPNNVPIELSGDQARTLAELLLQLADQADE